MDMRSHEICLKDLILAGMINSISMNLNLTIPVFGMLFPHHVEKINSHIVKIT